jgi:REP element-mobilizing transposase RayT
MTRGYKIHDQFATYFLTFQIVQWVDIFTRQLYRDIVIDSFNFCRLNKGFELFGYVIMSNHIHLIANSKEGKLSDTIRDMKRHTSTLILEKFMEESESRRVWMDLVFKYAAGAHTRNNTFQLWTHDNHPEEIISNKFLMQKLDYIHQNPVRAGIVTNPEDYLYSSARNYAGLESVCEVTLLTIV